MAKAGNSLSEEEAIVEALRPFAEFAKRMSETARSNPATPVFGIENTQYGSTVLTARDFVAAQEIVERFDRIRAKENATREGADRTGSAPVSAPENAHAPRTRP
ncbi:MAG: hypothetical protein ING19_08170 [Azospirillum sp.]|nr:hypothetical protein [Azospirillum sp.]